MEQVRQQAAEHAAAILDALDALRADFGAPPQDRRAARPATAPAPLAPALVSPARANGGGRYRELILRLRRVVAAVVPAGATVAVVSKGDPELLQLDGRQAWHFPQRDDGTYAGFHPKDSAAAIEELERARARGADFLLFPATSLWWLEHYEEFSAHLASRYAVALRDEQTGVLFMLRETSAGRPPAPRDKPQEYDRLVRQVREVVDSVLPPDATVLVMSKGDPGLLELGKRVASHFPQDAGGVYAGRHPADSAAVIASLEELQRVGAEFLVVPETAFSWFDHYQDFARHLEASSRAIVRQRHVCVIYELNGR